MWAGTWLIAWSTMVNRWWMCRRSCRRRCGCSPWATGARRDELGYARTDTVNRLHRLLLELLPGGAKKFLSAMQARKLIATVKPRDSAGKVRRRLAVELIGDLETIDRGCRRSICEVAPNPRRSRSVHSVGRRTRQWSSRNTEQQFNFGQA
ncbi:hypothetical protein [Nocardia sp. GAS34]|uniref:hypothetical protein n=1 Tax=unclassified Nocardia TaxID=2637762 RepID=UPI003D215B85